MAVILRQRRDTAANWATNNPVIPDGQLCFDETNNTFRIGDGAANYADLSIQSGIPGDLTEIVQDTTPQLGGDLDTNGKTFQGSSYDQIADASLGTGTHTFNYASGSMQQITATGSITLAITGFVSGKVCSFVFDAVDFGAVTITHPAAWLFVAGAAPSYTAAGTDRILLWHDKDDVVTLHVGDQDIKAV